VSDPSWECGEKEDPMEQAKLKDRLETTSTGANGDGCGGGSGPRVGCAPDADGLVSDPSWELAIEPSEFTLEPFLDLPQELMEEFARELCSPSASPEGGVCGSTVVSGTVPHPSSAVEPGIAEELARKLGCGGSSAAGVAAASVADQEVRGGGEEDGDAVPLELSFSEEDRLVDALHSGDAHIEGDVEVGECSAATDCGPPNVSPPS